MAEGTDADGTDGNDGTAPQGRLARLLAWWKQTRVARALGRYGAANGALLTGGMAYSALFSIFAALVVGLSIFMAVLGGDEQRRQAVLDARDSALRGTVRSGDCGPDLPDPLP